MQCDTVTCLITAGGLKDPRPSESIPSIPTVPPDLDRVLDVIEQVYGVDAMHVSDLRGEGEIA